MIKIEGKITADGGFNGRTDKLFALLGHLVVDNGQVVGFELMADYRLAEDGKSLRSDVIETGERSGHRVA